MRPSLYQAYGKRCLDVTASALGLLILSPLLVAIGALVWLSSTGPMVYCQARLGRGGRPFTMYKFRSMRVNQDPTASLVTAENDARMTPIGRWLRRYKLDELPQLWNVLKGDMSLVGPRPEVARYAQHYPDDYARILTVRPGITDDAALAFRNEEALLAGEADPESAYIQSILPKKIALYHQTMPRIGLWRDLRLIIQTLFN